METTQQILDSDRVLPLYASGDRHFQGVQLRGVRWQGRILSGADFKGSDFTKAQLQQAQLAQSNFSNSQFAQARLSEAQLNRAWFKRADLQRANLNGANLQEAQMKQACLAWAQMEGADCRRASLIATNLEHANLKGADFSQAVLSGADLRFAEMRHANFQRANLSGANLSGANLRWVDLSGANLRWADLSDAKLSGANLMGADLSNAILSGTSLVHADLTQASLNRVHWVGADLSHATLTGAKLWETPRFGVKTEDLICEWVDLSRGGDRDKIHQFATPQQAQAFLRPAQPQVQLTVDAGLEHQHNFILASFYHQVARKFPLLQSPPSAQVGQRRTHLSFTVARETDLLAIAYLIVNPFKNVKSVHHNILKLLETLQALGTQLDPAEHRAVEQTAAQLQPFIGQIRPVKLPSDSGTHSFFETPIQVMLQNSSGDMVTLYQHPQFGKRIVNISGTITRSAGLPQEARRASSIRAEEALGFLRGFYLLEV
ncbi:MAG: pentapeptide repeat-containing protein [Synechococcales cyanobacterium RM1_1_8]|nr:pentapeptide repeat-containing protein [Synechococcales cyanobacterium RM1_1_8]